MQEHNWAANYRYGAHRLHTPATVEQLQGIIAAAPRIRVLGSRHSFTGIADSDELVSLGALPSTIVVDRAGGTVTLGGAVTYGELAEELNAQGVALRNLGALPHVSVAGSVATATHGSGDANGNLATSVTGLEMVTSSGEVITCSRGDPDFEGLVVGLGALGAVTRLTLEIEPAYLVQQRVFEGLAWSALLDSFDEITSSGYSVSLFSRWGESVDQVWVKTRVGDAAKLPNDDFFGAKPATAGRHPIVGLDPINCTEQMGVPGPWHERLPHFRMGFTPSSGDEIQSEYLVPRVHAVGAIEALRGLGDRIRSLLQVSEIRTV
ncbi:MAG TPA: FAD-binding protein, partial [Actinomycetota bacterium]|nr:FAD-binding protein [Actinomycetota bacterium]